MKASYLWLGLGALVVYYVLKGQSDAAAAAAAGPSGTALALGITKEAGSIFTNIFGASKSASTLPTSTVGSGDVTAADQAWAAGYQGSAIITPA